uniref:glutamate receptor-interacting protein 2 isoform X2 n=1 Tax=Ciona intestinalis TaxID=7719 RepID=UPI000EF448F0|nr:glutamate receptor-interacting protein 2 isoform X2 [Ciona intestinalis]|eukprot:XP_009859030.2 glutamate receptor-interacting protein 2 isoform X2 [Ciona intestinalis]
MKFSMFDQYVCNCILTISPFVLSNFIYHYIFHTEAVTNASGPLLIEVSKVPGAELGITMAKSTYRKKPVICIDRVKPASISDRCGALHIGDHILSIDNISMATSSVREASDLLQSSSDQVKLEILPVSHLSIAATPFSQNRFTPLISSAQSLSALNTHRFRQPHGGTLTSYGRASSRMNRKRMQRPKYAASAMSLASTDFLSNNQVVHTEVTEVQLLTSDDITDPMTSSALPNFGIQLQGGIFSTELLTSPPFINFIEPDRPADRSGVLQSGDRLLTVNGYQCEDCTLDEVTQMLSDAYLSGMVVIEVEFDVAESVVPSSGTFHAKLPKRRGVDLGIVVGASSDGQDSLMILEVRRGSVAHRTGTLEAGDRLLAIDGVRLDGVSSEDAHALLASAEDVVRLKIRKDEDNSEDGDSSSISYTVELKRHGGPLGITISGTEETFDPIIISGLTPGGLADRTGAIHEGDKILSINNVSLRAKPLSDAIDLLQNAGESVVLKIKRQISEKPRKPSFATSTINRNPSMNEPITELSDPEDDILPPPMGPLPDHTPTDRTSTPKTPSEPPEPLLKGRGVRPGPAGAASVDSAVDSWGDGSDAYRTRSSTGSHQQSNLSPNLHDHLPTSTPTSGHSSTRSREQKKMDSNLRHFDKMRSKFEPGAPRTYSDTWGTRAHIRSRTNRSPERRHPPSTAPVADWQRALEDLKSVGQSTGYLHDLESKLTIGSEPRGRHQVFNHRRQASAKNTVSPSVPLQFHRLTLFKENMNEDFGFSLSDGQIEPGVFVHTVRPGGPAHRCGVLPYDRLLQVNSTNLHDSDCSRAIPIISSSRDRLDVLVSRYHGNTGGMATHPLLSPPVHLSPHMRQNDVFPTM